MKKPRVPIIARILGLNILLVFMPVASFLSLDTYEKSLLEALEGSMVQQGRVLAAWLGQIELSPPAARTVLESLGGRHTARLRVIDPRGVLLADSSAPQPLPAMETPDPPSRVSGKSSIDGDDRMEKAAETSFLYRLLSLPVRFYRRYLAPPAEPLASADFYANRRNFLEGEEIRAALEGRYGATTRISAGGQVSVTLYSALPIPGPIGAPRGAVLVSQSTYRILADIYRLRLEVGKIFLASLAVSLALSFLLWLSISRPLKRLGVQARSALSLSGLTAGHFEAGAVSDEICDLASALREFSSRLGERLTWSEDFAADLAHEIRNPLASIRAAAELLDGASPTENRKLAARIIRDVDRANRVVGGLRELSRIESEASVDESASVIECARNSARRISGQPETRAKRLKFTVETDGNVESLRAGIAPDRLAIALGALLDNAVSFSPEDGDIVIRIDRAEETDGPKVCIHVLDRGPGIPPEHLERIFDRFFSFREDGGDAGERESADHFGLGLALVQGIARRALGRTKASNRPDGGACLSLVLPEVSR